MKTTTSIQLRFNDIDMAGHAHNAVYLSWFEQARMDLLRNFIEKDHDWKKFGMILARNEVDYKRPVHLSDHVEVECSCSAIGTKSFDLGYSLFVTKAGERRLHAQGRSVMVCFDYTTNTSFAVPEAWRTKLARMMAER
ncbi:MAG: acyl-CoA thioesterase [Flavobacteriales bacterium]|nr:acyl-CoA thioesterase [Flavobacteriales bacterium]MBL0043120.1 acyl-CoA thioesterase [Flavobacteriales bacterium]